MKFSSEEPQPYNPENLPTNDSIELESNIEEYEDTEDNLEKEDDFDPEAELVIARSMAAVGNLRGLEEQVELLIDSKSINPNEVYLILVYAYTTRIEKLIRLATDVRQQKIDLGRDPALGPEDVTENDQSTPLNGVDHPNVKCLFDQASSLDAKRDVVIKKIDLVVSDEEYNEIIDQATTEEPLD